eukprot:gnl/Chilomastix_cuspidata/28.p1 GENE.gnl/Chilomastix_cuspidata/28~~gnl/Chilomastix_cuspidata/28.p1  ORF type:complete len:1181 (+),score=492.55 gnl/Chilomastix_cuspidata/28:1458-5000(+)
MQTHIHGAEKLKQYVPTVEEGATMVTMNINGQDVQVPESASILDACRTAGQFVPTICHHPRLKPLGRCQACVVENIETGNLAVSCSTPVEEGMKIVTDSARVRAKQSNVIRGLQLKKTQRIQFKDDLDVSEFDSLSQWTQCAEKQTNGAITINPSQCVECGRCVSACNQVQGMDILEIPASSSAQPVGGLKLTNLPCIGCGQCSSFCPAQAITEADHIDTVFSALASGKPTVVQTAPSIRVALGEEFGMAPGSITTGKMVAALRKLGFTYVLDTNFAADLTIMEEGTELLGRVGKLVSGDKDVAFPMFTSCCPGWINFVEQEAPDFIPNLSSCKSPMGMQSALLRTYFAEQLKLDPAEVFTCAIMPCTAKKQECQRSQLRLDGKRQDTDAVLTTRELGAMCRRAKIDFATLKEEEFDSPLGESTGAAVIFGVTGGVMEAALRTAYEVATGKPLDPITLVHSPVRGFEGIRETEIPLPLPSGEITLRIAVCSGILYARKLIEAIRAGSAPEYHFIEVMACPGGCIGGGGQPRSLNPRILEERAKATYTIDERMEIRKSHENPEIQQIYKDFLGEPNSHKAHKLLHTHYADRSATVQRPKDEDEDEEMDVPADGEPLSIIFATQTGNAKNFANRIASEARSKDVEFAVQVKPVNKVTPEWITSQKRILYISSTFGMGEQPDSAVEFWNWLKDCPEGSFNDIEFAVIGLGSKVYPLFCKAAVEVDEALEAKGGKRFLPMGFGDESNAEGHEAAIGPFIEKLWDELGASDSLSSGVPPSKYTCLHATGMHSPPPPPPGYEYVELSGKERIVPEEAPREALRLELDISKTSLKYETGWHLGVLPRADNEDVEHLCARLRINPDTAVVCNPREGATPIPGVTDFPLTIREILTQYIGITARASKPFFKKLIPFANVEDAARLTHLLSKEGAEEFKETIIDECISYVEAFDMFPSVMPTFEYLLEWIPVNKPRLYSIASSHLLRPTEIHLVVLVVDWETPKRKAKTGICTNFFRKIRPSADTRLAVYTKSSPLQPPRDPLAPITGIAMGCGIAPFRSFLEHRHALRLQGQELGPFTLYFGCRRMCEDAMCYEELMEYQREGIVNVVTAFSRETDKKVYVTHRLTENEKQIKCDLGSNDGFLGYCGPAGAAPANVEKIIKQHFLDEGLDADARWAELERLGLICIEAY